MIDSYPKIFSEIQKVMFVMAHPDDAEIYGGGTIARLVADGKVVRLIKMTSGNKGSRQEVISEADLAKTRLSEDLSAIKILGIKPEDNLCLDLGDGQVENTLTTIGKLAEQIRIFKPDLVVTHNPEHAIIRFEKNENWINHRDHRNTGLSALDAAYPYSRDLLFFPEHFKNIQAASHSVSKFLLIDYYDHPDVMGIEITKFNNIKIKSILAHSSQYDIPKATTITDFLNNDSDGNRYERFRYVVAD